MLTFLEIYTIQIDNTDMIQQIKDIVPDTSKNNKYNIFDQEEYVKNTTIEKDVLQKVFKAQNDLNPIFDKGFAEQYQQARNQIYPTAVRGSRNNVNRAGDKLVEMVNKANIQLDKIKYVGDICCIPGAWTLCIINKNKQAKSFLLSKKIDNQDYYNDIKKSKNCYIVEGVNGGDVYQKESLEQYLKKIQQVLNIQKENILTYTPALELFLGDGGFQINQHNGKHVEHLQEPITQRLFLCQVLYGLFTIKSQASMIIKCFECCSKFNIQLLHLTSILFDSISIIKTQHSRVTNSEKYILFHDLKANSQLVQQVIDILYQFFINYDDENCFKQIYSENQTKIQSFQKFNYKIDQISKDLMKYQTIGLNRVIQRTKELINRQGFHID